MATRHPMLSSVSNLPHFFLFYTSCLLVLSSLSNHLCHGFRPRHFNLSTAATHWSNAGATWYGAPDGFGSDGGSCGYGESVSQAPFSSMVTGIGPSLYNSGKECGACYQVKCTKHPSCSGKPARVVITDFCPGGVCASDRAHFDLSGTAFGAMAVPGQEKLLRDAGNLEIRFARVACDYAGKTLAFHVDQGSNSNYIAFVIEFEEGDGDLAGVGLMETGSLKTTSNNEQVITAEWRKMQQSWGAVWKLDAGGELQPPLSIRLTSQYSEQTLVAKNVIPVGWKPGATYRSLVNFL
ncbi:expansin-B15 [Daucus carota subsp. sativus]|nr:PREDICTED: expansin-B15-like [Daucus carota subsp. sativus]